MMVGLVLTDSGTLFDLNYTEFFKDRADDVLQDEKLIHGHDFVPVKNTDCPSSYVDILEIYINNNSEDTSVANLENRCQNHMLIDYPP
jgi:hypothetical protein